MTDDRDILIVRDGHVLEAIYDASERTEAKAHLARLKANYKGLFELRIAKPNLSTYEEAIYE
jgi:hypothetical protein